MGVHTEEPIDVLLTFVECVPVDLVFVMDDSGSVSVENFQTMLNFASNLLDSFKIGEEDTKVGLVVFSTFARRIFNFNMYSTRQQIQNAIKNSVYTGQGTNTAAALYEARQMFVSNSEKRLNAISLAIVLTDGKSNSPTDTVNRANDLHNAGVMVFCIGIGSNLDLGELRAIASNPDDKFLISANDFASLHSKITQLTNSLCIGKIYK
jgi:receptor-type tyrosine-protein phosphatase Q